MQVSIERVPLSELPYERFRTAYYDVPSPKPLLITGVPAPEGNLSVKEFSARYMHGAVKSIAWYDAPLAKDTLFPDLVKRMLKAPDSAVRTLPLRVWAHPAGHKTLLHYDGNSLCSFNLQWRGAKRWLLISPDTPLPMAPMQFVCLADRDFRPDPEKHDFCEVETHPGEMLYLPRYWTHGVHALGDVNLNLNWVWTPRRPSNTKNGRRERELLALRRASGLLNRLCSGDLETYGGDPGIIDAYVEGVSGSAMLQRLGRELAMAPRMLRNLRTVLGQVRTFEQNNFNVPKDA
jgi:hypothetical protein